MQESDIQSRKTDHIDLTARGNVTFRDKTTLFECVRLVHDSLPELSLEALDLSCEIMGKRLRAPLLVAGMTGGTERAGQINKIVATVVEKRGLAMGLGSQRPMLRDPATAGTFCVRDVAPNALLLGNIGVVQAAQTDVAAIRALTDTTGVDGLCLHLNPAMEVVQPGGDRDFRGCLRATERLVSELGVPIVAKETGCGLSQTVARRLKDVGVKHLDVSGAGGTSWVAVEALRAKGEQAALGQRFWDWGIPTAASVQMVSPLAFETVFATGGVSNGVEVAKAITLGANAGGIARPVLKALDAAWTAAEASGADPVAAATAAVDAFLARVEGELAATMLLVGAANLKELAGVQKLISGELREWLALSGSASSNGGC